MPAIAMACMPQCYRSLIAERACSSICSAMQAVVFACCILQGLTNDLRVNLIHCQPAASIASALPTVNCVVSELFMLSLSHPSALQMPLKGACSRMATLCMAPAGAGTGTGAAGAGGAAVSTCSMALVDQTQRYCPVQCVNVPP